MKTVEQLKPRMHGSDSEGRRISFIIQAGVKKTADAFGVGGETIVKTCRVFSNKK
jgi:hypothetical protein